MTNLYTIPRLRAHALSAAVGSGKTRAAVAWMCSPATAGRNVLYVAPTLDLVEQTTRGLRDAIKGATTATARNVHMIHCENVGGNVQAEALEAINEVGTDAGHVRVITTRTFLSIATRVQRPELWSVILDEAFDPATFTSFRLGTDELAGWAHFSELFRVDPEQGHRIVPCEGKRALVDEVGRGVYGNAGDRFMALGEVAKSVANDAIRCELVMTTGAAALVNGMELPKRAKSKRRGAADDEEAAATLQFASYVDPMAFDGFREVLFLSALFEETILYHLWTRALGVKFTEHPDFPSKLLRDTHAEQGRFMAVGHLLHRDDMASLENLKRNALTGLSAGMSRAGHREDIRAGSRVIDHMVRSASEHFGDAPFLLQTNQRYGYVSGAHSMPGRATWIPPVAHGMNAFEGADNVAALCVTNPNRQQTKWIKDRTGMSEANITRSYRIHTVYQAVGRCSIRNASRATEPKVVLTAGHADAKFLHDLFAGSHWLGQVGTIGRLPRHNEGASAAPGRIDLVAGAIRRFLGFIPPEGNQEGRDKVSSRALRADLSAETCNRVLLKDGAASFDLTATERAALLDIPPRTWAAAVRQACVAGQRWQLQASSLQRVTAELYGFEKDAA